MRGRFSDMLDQDFRLVSPVGLAARDRDRAHDVEAADIGISPGLIDLAQYIERPELGNRDGHARVCDVRIPQRQNELVP